MYARKMSENPEIEMFEIAFPDCLYKIAPIFLWMK